MRIPLSLLALALSVPVQAGFFTTESPEKQFAAQVEQWADTKIQEFTVKFKGDLPMLVEGEVRRIDSSKSSFVYETIEPMNDKLQSDFVKYQKDMVKLRQTYDIAVATLNDFTGTQAWFESEIEKYASDFDTAVVRDYRNAVLFDYCKSHEIEQSKCKSNRDMSSGMPKPHELLSGKVILMRHLLDAQPQYRKHLDWLKSNVESINSFIRKVAEHGVAFEKNLYFRRAASSGCKNMTDFDDGAFALQIVYANYRPQKSVVYNLGQFKVLQSLSGGVLMATIYPDGYKAPLIFVETSNKYTDGYTFEPGEAFACLSGTKEYLSVLGAKKRVMSFRVIQDNSEYHFMEH